MGFHEAIATGFRKYVVFDGRATRSEFWWWVLFTIVAQLAAIAIDTTLFDAPTLQWLFGLAVLLPGIAVSVRRLHDLDKSGVWYLLVLVPIIGPLVLIFFFVQRGTEGANQYGADPLG